MKLSYKIIDIIEETRDHYFYRQIIDIIRQKTGANVSVSRLKHWDSILRRAKGWAPKKRATIKNLLEANDPKRNNNEIIVEW